MSGRRGAGSTGRDHPWRQRRWSGRRSGRSHPRRRRRWPCHPRAHAHAGGRPVHRGGPAASSTGPVAGELAHTGAGSATEHTAVLSELVDGLRLDEFLLTDQDWGGPIGLGAAVSRADRVGGSRPGDRAGQHRVLARRTAGGPGVRPGHEQPPRSAPHPRGEPPRGTVPARQVRSRPDRGRGRPLPPSPTHGRGPLRPRGRTSRRSVLAEAPHLPLHRLVTALAEAEHRGESHPAQGSGPRRLAARRPDHRRRPVRPGPRTPPPGRPSDRSPSTEHQRPHPGSREEPAT
ncbi:hypothetical protein CFP65_2033 [Kitasatospora sp. MMS16-BH015]|nr:hypothetical protein CFP65_2033 [Kitasatospora sp. MMS16-BH015]